MEEGIIVPSGGEHIPPNQVHVEGGATKEGGAEIKGSIQHDTTHSSFGVEGGVSQKKGWSAGGFFTWFFGGR